MYPYLIIPVLISTVLILSCTTSYMEFQGECVTQEWTLSSLTLRKRQICDLPAPNMVYKDQGETAVSDREAMNINPFPDVLGPNPADSFDPNLLEKRRARNQIQAAGTEEEVRMIVKHYNTLGGEPLDIEAVLKYKGIESTGKEFDTEGQL